ncbi:MAG: alpha/beta fold hydrolase [Elusimicrobiaceae bacterium]|nr:alpha/beta fold hydrolase [Elusimicrobiaceae bacterium]
MSTIFHIILGSILGVAFIILAVVVFCKRAAKKMLHPKAKRKPLCAWPDQFGLKYENVSFRTADGITLKGWWIAAEDSAKTIILMHGWGMNRSAILPHTCFLRDLGYNLFYFDFRALGESGGDMSSIGYLELKDIRAAITFLKEKYPAQCQKIGLYGISLGGMVALGETSRNPEIACVVAEAPYYSFRRVVSRWAWIHYHLPYFPLLPIMLHYVRRELKANPERYSPKYTISKIAPRPLFIIHGRYDNLVPAAHARHLYREAGEPKSLWLVPDAKHDKCGEVGGFAYKQKLADFFRTYL